MRKVMVRYRVKPGRVKENEELVRAVYAELERNQPTDMQYSTHSLDDGRTFVHLHEGESAGLTELEAFQEFQRDLRDRCEEPPVVTELRRSHLRRRAAACRAHSLRRPSLTPSRSPSQAPLRLHRGLTDDW